MIQRCSQHVFNIGMALQPLALKTECLCHHQVIRRFAEVGIKGLAVIDQNGLPFDPAKGIVSKKDNGNVFICSGNGFQFTAVKAKASVTGECQDRCILIGIGRSKRRRDGIA